MFKVKKNKETQIDQLFFVITSIIQFEWIKTKKKVATYNLHLFFYLN